MFEIASKEMGALSPLASLLIKLGATKVAITVQYPDGSTYGQLTANNTTASYWAYLSAGVFSIEDILPEPPSFSPELRNQTIMRLASEASKILGKPISVSLGAPYLYASEDQVFLHDHGVSFTMRIPDAE